jgi:microcin C transport system substrate-binding protein
LKKKQQKNFCKLAPGGSADIASCHENYLVLGPRRLFLERKAPAFGFMALLFFLFPIAASAGSNIITFSAVPPPPPGFKSLPYANPDAPKGGSFTTAAIGVFDNLNPFILAGTAPDSIFRIWQPLFKPSDTDSVTAYADLAQSADISADGLTITFHLNPAARFSDGVPVTAADVIWTYRTLITQGAPIYAALYTGIVSATAPDPQTAIFTFGKGAGRAQLLNLAEMYVLPAHFWRSRNFAAPLLTFPIGSGAYQVAAVDYGASITYAHVKNWWAETLPAERGFDNFAIVTQQFFHSDAVALQAFKAGQIDARIEDSSALWARAYHFPAIQDGSVVLAQVPLTLPAGINGLVMNTRRPPLDDARVRHALTLAFDFEWTNKHLYQDAEVREHSYFTNSPMAASGPPGRAEQALLAPFRGQIPASVWTAFQLPVTDASGYNFPQLTQALALLGQAGWRVKNFKLVNEAGQPFRLEILLDDPAGEAILLPYVADLRRLGIDATIRTIDPNAYQRRLDADDFDMTQASFPATDYPDTEQAAYWGCAAARTAGGDNLAGICTPAIDAMIQAEIAAPSLAAKTTAMHALDRLLLNGWYIIPFGVRRFEDVAYWRTKVVKPDAALQIGVDYDLWWAK